MEKLLKEVRKTNSTERSLRDTLMALNQLLLLDEMLLKAELSVGLMDGVPFPIKEAPAND